MNKITSVKDKVADAFEEFRQYLVSLLGDIHGVHSTIDNAKAAIAEHVPEEEVPADSNTASNTAEAKEELTPAGDKPVSE